MAQDEEQRRSRVVVETPHARREVEHVEYERAPEDKGFSTGMVVTVALVAIAATAIIIMLLMNRNSDTSTDNINVNMRAAATPVPTAPTPIVVPSAAPPPGVQTTQPAPIIIAPPTNGTTTNVPPSAPTPAPTPDDSAIQANVSKKFLDDPDLASTDVSANVGGGKAILTGTVSTPDLKRRAERLALTVKGVKSVVNKINVQNANANLNPNALPTP